MAFFRGGFFGLCPQNDNADGIKYEIAAVATLPRNDSGRRVAKIFKKSKKVGQIAFLSAL